MGFFDGLLERTQNPLFLGGVNLMMGAGPQGMMQGMAMGSDMQERARKRAQEEQRNKAMQGALGGLQLNPQEQQFLAASPEAGTELLQRLLMERNDPMSGIKRKTAEANLQQTQLENSLFPLKSQQIESQIAQNRAQMEQGRNGKYGLQPVYGVDADGNPIIMQLGPSGEAIQTKLPGGARVDLGMKSREQAIGTASGKVQGEARLNLPGVEYNSRKITELIDGVLKDPYLGNMTGPVVGRLPNLSGNANRVQSKIDQIQGKTFLQAYESLKGSGQITEIEGAKAESSLQRLQNTRVGTEDYVSALQEFKQDISDLAQIARQKAGGGYQPRQQLAPQQPDTGGWSIRRID